MHGENVLRNSKSRGVNSNKKVYDYVILLENNNKLSNFIIVWGKANLRYMKNSLKKEDLFTYFIYIYWPPLKLRMNIYISNPMESFNLNIKRKRKIYTIY